MAAKIKVLLVDDHAIVRDGLKMLLDLNASIQVCGEAGTLKDALEIIPKAKPELILLDFKLPDGDGVSSCTMIKRLYPEVKIIILTAYSQNHLVLEAIRAGADGYLLKNIKYDVLCDTIKLVHQGSHILDPAVSEGVIQSLTKEGDSPGEEGLSPRELAIIELISAGKSNKEIGLLLAISDKTVRNYISTIFKKINVTNRTEAASYWLRRENKSTR